LLPPPFPVSTPTIACFPHALLISVHQTHPSAHDGFMAFGRERIRALSVTGVVMRAA